MYNIVVGPVSDKKLLAVLVWHSSSESACVRALNAFDFVGPVRVQSRHARLDDAEQAEQEANKQFLRIEAGIARLQQYATGRG